MRFTFAAAALLLCTSCATAINGRWETVPVESYPSGAKIAVACGTSPVDAGVTPVQVRIERRARDCRLTLSKLGYEPQEIVFERQMSRATHVNRIAGVPVGLIAALGIGLLMPEEIMDTDEALAGGFQAGMQLGSAPGNQIDKQLGGAYKQVPGKLFVVLVRAPKEHE